MQQFNLSDYPIVIEPTVETLDVAGSVDSNADGQVHLHRVDTVEVFTHLPFLPNGLVHFFGLHGSFSENQFLLAYSGLGLLNKVLRRDDTDSWDTLDVPGEVTGSAVSLPSLRLIFKTVRARNAFYQHLQLINEGKAHNASLAVLLEQLAEPIRIIDVWKK